MKPSLSLLIVTFPLLAFLLPSTGCGSPAEHAEAMCVQSPPSGDAIPASSAKVPAFARTDAELRILLAEHDRQLVATVTDGCRKAFDAARRIPGLYAEATRLENELKVLELELARERYEARRAARRELAAGADYATVKKAFAERQQALSAQFAAATSQPAERLKQVKDELHRTFCETDIRGRSEKIDEYRRAYLIECQSAERQLEIVIDSLHSEPTLETRIDWLRGVSLAQIVVNWPALKNVGITRETEVRGLFDERTVGEELTAILKSADAAGRIRVYSVENVIVVSTPAGWEQTQALRKESMDRSDSAGRDWLGTSARVWITCVPLTTTAGYFADLYKLRLNKSAIAESGGDEIEVSCRARCSRLLMIRLLLDDIDDGPAWTFRVVAGELILEPVPVRPMRR